jgi:WXG100 family type VII secretion target
MTTLAIDLHALERFIARLEWYSAHLDRVRADLDTRVTHLHGEWKGAGAAAQAAAHRRWARGAADVHEALTALRSLAATAHGNYAEAVQANRRMWAL